MIKKLTILLFFCFLVFSIEASEKSCEMHNVKIIFDKKPIVSNEEMCRFIDEDNSLYYMSKSCLFYGCEVLKKKKGKLVIPNYYGKIGSPGFKLCEELGGVPQIFEFQKKSVSKNDWQNTERCLFNKRDFVEISYLTKEWKTYIKSE